MKVASLSAYPPAQTPNPYQPPVAIDPKFGYGAPPGAMAGGIWRHGDMLIMHKSAQLPDVCVKSGLPAQRRLKRNLQWFNPLIYLTLFLAVLLYIVLVAVLSQRATIFIPLTDEWFKRRRMRMLIAWIIGLAGGLIFFGSFALVDQFEPWPLIMLLGIIVFLGSLFYGKYACRMVHPKKIDEQYIYLKGVHSNVLAMFPEWPYPV